MRKCLTALLCALLTAAVLGLATPQPAQAADGGAEAAFVAQLNGIRASKGLAPLAMHGELTGIARGWTDQMARSGGISHNGSFDSQVSANWRKLGENVGVGSNVDELVQAFVNSPAHYRNIVDPAFNYIGVGENGTPLQKDEPQSPNPPNGAAIDYYLRKSATTPVTIEIVDSSGAILHTFSSAPTGEGDASETAGSAGSGSPGSPIPRVSPLWQENARPISSAAGMHRVVWNPVVVPNRGPLTGGAAVFPRGDITQLSGRFTARLTVGTTVRTRSFTVKADPRTRE